MSSLLFALLTLTFALPVFAAEGQLEINQTCAVNTGCSASDGPGFPVTIADAGSYVLTSNLQLPNANTRGIEIQVSNVTLNLGGFEIRGVTTCAGTPLVCAPLGSGEGVAVQNTFLIRDVRVMNGTVSQAGHHGVVVGVRGVVERVNATQNGMIGIFGDRGSILRDNVAGENGSNGFNGALNATITGNSAYQNALHGIFAGSGSSVAGNNATENATGIVAGAGSTVSRNTAYKNRLNGIEGGDGSLILGNTASINGGSLPLVGDGIRCGERCWIRGNMARNNFSRGLFLGTESGYQDNVFAGNLVEAVNVITPGDLLGNSPDPHDVGGNYIVP